MRGARVKWTFEEGLCLFILVGKLSEMLWLRAQVTLQEIPPLLNY